MLDKMFALLQGLLYYISIYLNYIERVLKIFFGFIPELPNSHQIQNRSQTDKLKLGGPGCPSFARFYGIP